MAAESSVVSVDLDAGTEWRFELEQDEAIAVRVSWLGLVFRLCFFSIWSGLVWWWYKPYVGTDFFSGHAELRECRLQRLLSYESTLLTFKPPLDLAIHPIMIVPVLFVIPIV